MTPTKKGKRLDFETIFVSLPTLYLILYSDFTIADANDAYLQAAMVERNDIIGRNIFDVFPDNPDDPNATGVTNLRASLNRVLKNKTSDTMAIQKYDIRRPQSEGGGFEERYWSPVNLPILGKNKKVEYIIHRVEDVTDFILLKKTGAQQLKIMDELRTRAGKMEVEIYQRAQEIQKTNDQLNLANKELEKKEKEQVQLNKHLAKLSRMKTQFFSNVSHELRTPLMLILGPLENLLASDMSPAHLHSLKLIESNARILLKHVNDLLDAAKLETGKMLIHYTNTNLSQLVKQTAALFEARVQERQLHFYMNVPDVVNAEIDADKIQRVIMNLLSNALKFTPPNGEITLTLTTENTHATIIVADNGPGIPSELHETIFERFFQAEESTTREFGGSGLGLAIVKDFVELHGGSIRASRPPSGKGAVFTVDLPIKAPQNIPVTATREKSFTLTEEITPQLIEELKIKANPSISIHNQNKVRNYSDKPLILVIEDNQEMNQFICENLSDHYRIESAFDGKQGLEKALSILPDLIISDVMMPYMNGIQLTHEIRQQAKLLTTPIMILTAKPDDELCVKMLREGAQDYMKKPFSLNEFKARIANLILAKNAEDELERFVYIASHDLKSPLPAIEHLATWIEEDTGEHLSPKSKEHLTLLKQRARRMADLLDGLLKYSQADHLDKTITPVNTQKLVEEIINKLNPSNEFVIDIIHPLPVFQTAKNSLEYVFCCLIDNSIQHYQGASGHISIDVTETDNFYEFSVTDDGPGIELEFHNKIFELFQTLQSRDAFESRGVGLSVAKKIIDSQGGKIMLFSEKNKGTTFRFTWPKHHPSTQMSFGDTI